MNHLAHFLLARGDAGLTLGGLLGDFIKGEDALRELERRDPALHRGVVLHRGIDSFADHHPRQLLWRHRFSPARRRYAGALLDLFHDHFLSRHWERFCDQPLAPFSAEVCRILHDHRRRLTAPARRFAARLARHQLLCHYGEVQTLAAVLHRLSRRGPGHGPLLHAEEELLRHHATLERHFLDFFPELVRHVRQLRSQWEQGPSTAVQPALRQG